MRILAWLLLLVFWGLPSVVSAQQIAPNPNPSGNTIFLDTAGWYNRAPFSNYGGIGILPTGRLANEDDLELDGFITVEGVLQNTGSIVAQSASIQTIEGSVFTSDSYLSLNNESSLVGEGYVELDGIVDLSHSSQIICNYPSEFINRATLKMTVTSTMNITAPLQNHGWIVIGNDCGLYHSGTLEDGNFQNHGTIHSNAEFDTSGFTNESGGTFEAQDGGSDISRASLYYAINQSGGTVINGCDDFLTYEFDNFGVFTNDPPAIHEATSRDRFTNHATGEFENQGTFESLGTFINEGTMSGTGTLIGTLTDHGVLAPGNSAGGMRIQGDWLKTDGSLDVELGGTFDGAGDRTLTEFDWVEVTGNCSVAGKLNVQLIDGFALSGSMHFEIVSVGGSRAGEFVGLPEGSVVGNFDGVDLMITYTAGDGNDVALYTATDPTLPMGRKVLDGMVVSGGLGDLHDSDDQRWEFEPSPTSNLMKQKVDVLLVGTSQVTSPQTFRFRLEARMNGGNAGPVIQQIYLIRTGTNRKELVDSRPVSNSDETIEITPQGDPSRFVNPINGDVIARVVYLTDPNGPLFPWSVELDQAVWMIQ